MLAFAFLAIFIGMVIIMVVLVCMVVIIFIAMRIVTIAVKRNAVKIFGIANRYTNISPISDLGKT